MIPVNKQVVVRKALQAAFGVNEFEDIQQLTKGLSSALIFKIIIHGKAYLLRVITRKDAMADPSHYFTSMKVAAKAGLAPQIHYLNIKDRISITDFIEGQPFPLDEARVKMADTLRQLHGLPKFPFRINYFDASEEFISKLLLSHMLPRDITNQLYNIYDQVAAVYPRRDKANLVSSHNDLKPENFIYDGRRPWLIDWEAAFLNDRYLDLAVVANFVVSNEDEESTYLERYFGKVADEYQRARFFLMQQILHVYYFTIFIMVGAEGKPVDTRNIIYPDFRPFHDQMWKGEINLADNAAKLQYAWVHQKEFIRKTSTERFEDSLHIVAEHRKIPK
jgi:thiamine kinase-like enzyme